MGVFIPGCDGAEIYLLFILTFFDLRIYYNHIDKTRFEVGALDDQYAQRAMIFKAFCDENRLKILEMLQSGEKCACKILAKLEIGQSTLSHHMKILVDSGIVTARNEGKWTHYSICEAKAQYAKNLLSQITAVRVEEDCKCKF